MENKKITVIVSVLIAVIVLFILAIVFFRMGAKTATRSLLQNNPQMMAPSNQTQAIVSDKTKIPSTVTGVVASVSADKIVVKQFANFDLEYAINKSDVASVVSYQKNPDFNQTKLDAKQQELQDKFKTQGIDMSQPPVAPGNSNANSPQDQQKQAEIQKVMDEFTKAMEADPTLKETVEKPMDFSEIKTGVQVNFLKDEKGSGKIVVYPSDINIGPPK